MFFIMNFKINFSVVIICLSIVNIQSAALKPDGKHIKEYKYKPSGLLIFLDQNETNKAIENELVEALKTLRCPVIATTYLLGKQKDNPYISRHIIKKINDNLYLLIPNDYIKELKIAESDIKKYEASSLVSDVELRFGLRVNHMEEIDATNLQSIDPIDGYISIFNDIISFKNIFCTNKDYFDANKIKQESKQPEIDIKRKWFIFISGHGGGDQIVGISLNDFSKFLDFLEKDVSTQLLVYLSCFAAGVMANKIYANNTKTYNFAIITAALTDASVWTANANDNLNYLRKFIENINEFDNKYDYALLVQDLLKGYSQDFNYTNNYPQIKLPGSQFFHPIGSVGIKSGLADGKIAIGKDSNVYDHKDIVTISKTLAQHRDPSLPLNVLKYFKINPTMIALDAQYIPFELVIDSTSPQQQLNIRAIASVIPGNAMHIIKKISSSWDSPFNIVDMFKRMNIGNTGLDSKKIFFIKEIEGPSSIIKKMTDVVIFSKNWILPNSSDYRSFFEVYKKEDGSIRYESSNDQAKLLYDNCLKLYENFMGRLENKPIELGTNAIEIKELVGSVDEISTKLKENEFSSYIFDQVELIDEYAFLNRLLEIIKLSTIDGIPHCFGLIFLKNFKCNYNGFIRAMLDDFKIINIKNEQDDHSFNINEEIVTVDSHKKKNNNHFSKFAKLDNVLIDGLYNKLFFTYKDKFYEVNLQNKVSAFGVFEKTVIATTDNYIKKYPMLKDYFIQAEMEGDLGQRSVDAILHKKLAQAKELQHSYDQSGLTSLVVSLATL